MDYYLLMSVLSFSALLSCISCQSCEQSYYERCLKELIDFADQSSLIFEASELEEECVQAQNSLGCLTRYAKKCLPPEERSKIMDAISGPQKLTLGLCTDETSFRSRYVKSLPCFRNMSSSEVQ